MALTRCLTKLILISLLGIVSEWSCFAQEVDHAKCDPPHELSAEWESAVDHCYVEADEEGKCVQGCLMERLQLADADGWPDGLKLATIIVADPQFNPFRDMLARVFVKCIQRAKKNNGESQNICERMSGMEECVVEGYMMECG